MRGKVGESKTAESKVTKCNVTKGEAPDICSEARAKRFGWFAASSQGRLQSSVLHGDCPATPAWLKRDDEE